MACPRGCFVGLEATKNRSEDPIIWLVKKLYFLTLLKFMIFFLSFYNSTDYAWSTIGKHINRLWGSPQGVDDGFGRLHRPVQGLRRGHATFILYLGENLNQEETPSGPLLCQMSAGIIATNLSVIVLLLCVGYLNRTRVPLESFDVRNADTKSV